MAWDELLAIVREQAQDAVRGEQERRRPAACPNDGEPLAAGPDGRLVCPYDGWRPDF